MSYYSNQQQGYSAGHSSRGSADGYGDARLAKANYRHSKPSQETLNFTDVQGNPQTIPLHYNPAEQGQVVQCCDPWNERVYYLPFHLLDRTNGLETHVHNKTGRRAQICMKNQVGKCNMREKCLQIHGDWNMVEKLRQLYIADKKAYVSEVLAVDVTDQLGDVLSFRYSEIEPGAAKEAYRRNYSKAGNKQVELCASYVRTGACSYGTQCSAIHVSHERYVKAKALRAQPQQQGSYKGGGGGGGGGYGSRGYHAQQQQHHHHHGNQHHHQQGSGRWGAEGSAGNGAVHYDDGCGGGAAPLPADSAEMAEMVMRAMAEGSYDLPQEYAAAAAAAAAAAMQQQQRQQQQQQQQWTAVDLRAAEREEVNSDSNSSQGASWFQSNDSSHEFAAAGSSGGGGAQGSVASGSLPASVAHVSPNSFAPSYPTSPLPAATIEPVYAAPECTPYEAALAVERAAAATPVAAATAGGAPPVNLEENDDIQRLLNDLQLDFE